MAQIDVVSCRGFPKMNLQWLLVPQKAVLECSTQLEPRNHLYCTDNIIETPFIRLNGRHSTIRIIYSPARMGN